MGNEVVLPKEVALFKWWPICKYVLFTVMVIIRASNLSGKLRIVSVYTTAVIIACQLIMGVKYLAKTDFCQGVVVGRTVTMFLGAVRSLSGIILGRGPSRVSRR